MQELRAFLRDLQDTLPSHGVSLFIDVLGTPERAPFRFLVRFDDKGEDVKILPEAGTEPGAHQLDGVRDTSPNKLDKIVKLINFESSDDKFCQVVLILLPGKIEGDVLHGEVEKMGRVADGNSDGHYAVFGIINRGDAEIERGEVSSEIFIVVNQVAPLSKMNG